MLTAPAASASRLIDLLEGLDRVRRPRLTVLMYHRVSEPDATPTLGPMLLSASPADFEEQLGYLASSRRVLSLDELLEIRRGGAPLPRRSVYMTFDDAYRDFARHAWPALRRHGLPATLFVPTAYPDAPDRRFWWDRLDHALAGTRGTEPLSGPTGPLPIETREDRIRAFRLLRDRVRTTSHHTAMAEVERVLAQLDVPEAPPSVLSWDELRRLAAEGVSVAPHSRTHPLLDQVALKEAQGEVLGSAEDLEREIGSSPPVFAFPAGGHNEELVRWLPSAGFEIAFATTRGSNDLRSVDWLRVRRINVGSRSPLPVLRAQLLFLAPSGAGRRSRVPPS